MGGVVNTIKGAFSSAGNVIGGQTNVAPVDLNRLYKTPYSTLQSGAISLDPTIRSLQDEGLTGLRGVLGNVGNLRSQTGTNVRNILDRYRLSSAGLSGAITQPGPSTVRIQDILDAGGPDALRIQQILDQGGPDAARLQGVIGQDLPSTSGLQALQTQRQGTLTDLIGNRGDFINARLDPLRRALAQREGGLRRELGRTGVRGTFANQALTNLGIEGQQALREAEASALDQALSQERAAAGELFTGEQAILGAEAGLRGQRTAEEQALLSAEQGLLGQRLAGEQALLGQERGIRGEQLAGEQGLLAAQQGLRQQSVDEQTRLFEVDQAIRSGELSGEAGLATLLSGLAGQEGQINQTIIDIGSGRLNQELAQLGLSTSSISALIAAAQGAQEAKDAAERGAVNTLGRIGTGVLTGLTGSVF